MNTDSLDDLWHSAFNRPENEASQRLAAHFVSRLRSRRRFQAWWLAWTSSLLMVASVFAVVHVGKAGLGGVRGQWASLFMLAPPWLVLAYFLRAFIRRGAGAGISAQPLRAALAAAQVSNAAERRHVRLVGALFAFMAPLTALAVRQLSVAGKVPGDQVWSMAFAFGLVFTFGVVGLLARYYLQLLPEQRTIQARLRELDALILG